MLGSELFESLSPCCLHRVLWSVEKLEYSRGVRGTGDRPTDHSVVESATAPFQCAMSTRAGTECIAHAFRATILSIDGVGAFDLICRKLTLEALLELETGSGVLTFDTICSTGTSRRICGSSTEAWSTR